MYLTFDYIAYSVSVGDRAPCPSLKVEVQAGKQFNETFSVGKCSHNCGVLVCLESVSPIEGFIVNQIDCFSFMVSFFAFQ